MFLSEYSEVAKSFPSREKNRKSANLSKCTDPLKFTIFCNQNIKEEPALIDDEPPLPKGGYSVDFDKFDDPNFNPFETKKPPMANSPTPGEEPIVQKGAYSVDQFDDPNFNPFESKKPPMANSPTNIPEKPTKLPQETEDLKIDDLNELNTELEPPKKAPPKLGANRAKVVKKRPVVKKTEPVVTATMVDDEPPIAKGGYSVDFDKFDDPNFNPFETKKPPMANSPPLSKGAYSPDQFDDPNFNPFESKKPPMANSPTNIPEKLPQETEDLKIDDLNELNTELEPPKKSPPKLGANRAKVIKKRPVAKEMVVKKPEPVVTTRVVDEEVPIEKGGYSVDFDKFDDPNFNPFETKKPPMANSPELPIPPSKGTVLEHRK
jgi:hypothetical protein